MMTRTVPILAALACFMPLAACANMEGDWPSLKTPAERQAGTCNDTRLALAETPVRGSGAETAAAQAGSGGPTLAAVATRIAEEQRDFTMALQNWTKQRAAAESAVNAAAGAAPASQAWATAQLEMSRFDQTAARFDQIRDAVSRAAGDLAVLAAGGANVSTTLMEAGQLLRRIDDAIAAHQAVAGPLQARLPR